MTKEARLHNAGKTVPSTNGAGKSGHSHVTTTTKKVEIIL